MFDCRDSSLGNRSFVTLVTLPPNGASQRPIKISNRPPYQNNLSCKVSVRPETNHVNQIQYIPQESRSCPSPPCSCPAERRSPPPPALWTSWRWSQYWRH